ncbi:hypothetical protein ACWDTG_01735 [Rhodococcus zopfii]|uniref:hypothetical protein n=1 Tax=Rhodococcus zopfii TaxID=43772 RepID=UPI003B8A848B
MGEQGPQVLGGAALRRSAEFLPGRRGITAMRAPARYSPTATVPTNDSTAIGSTPTRPRRSASITTWPGRSPPRCR